MKLGKINNNRKQTLIFLDIAKRVRGVTFVDEVKITESKMKYATAILIRSISKAIEKFPHLNCMVKYGSSTKLIMMHKISSRLTVSDGGSNNQPGVYSYLLENTDKLQTIDIYNNILTLKNTGVKNIESYKKIERIQKYPYLLGGLVSKLALLLNQRLQRDLFGSFTVTSLGKSSQHLCIPISGSTFTFTLGSPKFSNNGFFTLNIVMVFDHRVLDGLEASLFLNQIKNNFSLYESEEEFLK